MDAIGSCKQRGKSHTSDNKLLHISHISTSILEPTMGFPAHGAP